MWDCSFRLGDRVLVRGAHSESPGVVCARYVRAGRCHAIGVRLRRANGTEYRVRVDNGTRLVFLGRDQEEDGVG